MFTDLETEIQRLDGVISCRITGKEEVDEIHIVADKSREAKRIVRDIETIILVNTDQEISHKKISIAEINKLNKDKYQDSIEIIAIYPKNNQSTCHIELSINDNLIEKELEVDTGVPISFVVAQGLLEVINDYGNLNEKLRLENVFTTGIKEEVLLVQIVSHNLETGYNQQKFVGATYINGNIPLAAGQSCLNALKINSKLK